MVVKIPAFDRGYKSGSELVHLWLFFQRGVPGKEQAPAGAVEGVAV